ncbi:MAG: zinc ribbon domain-containing protein [Thermoplasmata archaeon]
MNCDNCGAVLPKGADFCASCGAKVGTVTKSMAVVQDVGEKTVDLVQRAGEKAKPLAKKGLEVTTGALKKIGDGTKKLGKKIVEKGEE